MWYSRPGSSGQIAIPPSPEDSPMRQCYRYRETRENLVPCSRCQAQYTAIFRMSETWREEEQVACSSCSTFNTSAIGSFISFHKTLSVAAALSVGAIGSFSLEHAYR